MAPVSLSYLPSACVRSSSVSLPHCSFTLPRSCCHLPLMMSRFILLLLSVRDVRCNGEEKLQGMCPRFWGRCGGRLGQPGSDLPTGKNFTLPALLLSSMRSIRTSTIEENAAIQCELAAPLVMRRGNLGTAIAYGLVWGSAKCEVNVRSVNGGRHEHHPGRVAGASSGRRAAVVALQQRLGLLPERRARIGPADRADPGAQRTAIGKRGGCRQAWQRSRDLDETSEGSHGQKQGRHRYHGRRTGRLRGHARAGPEHDRQEQQDDPGDQVR